MKNRLRTLCCLALAPPLLATGCGGGDARGDGELVLSVWDDGRKEGSFDVAAREFEKANAGVTVTVKKTPFDQHLQALRRQLATGRAPDVALTVLGYGESGTARALADKGLLADLSAASWAGGIPKDYRSVVGDGSKVYGLPIDTMAIGVLAPKGTPVPKTFSEVLSRCREAAAGGKAAFAMAGHEDSKMPHIVGFALAASTVFADDPGHAAKRLANQATFAGTAGWAKAVERFGQMKDARCFAEGVAGTTREAAARSLGEGKAQMVVAPTVTLPLWQAAAPKTTFTMFPFPGDDDPARVRVPAGPSSGLVVPAKAGAPALAKRFVDHYAAHRVRYTALDDAVPAIPEGPDARRVPAYAAALEPYLRDGRTSPIMDQHWPNPELITLFDSGLVKILNGRTGPADVLRPMDAAWTSKAP
ncbi:ABC transporter substrate-binding protein [Actinomadura rugatobispora]|uniref:ABC transporter substrate-binding protein n=1 Tax=Actinomadura rugatobispora TaxID=1994 RepID=A0ABW0ZWI9_9ACTN|nr:extracellular solute-binding protein [Actinomadura rugatobispora]